MRGQRAVEPPVWGQGQKTPMKRLRHLWILFTTEEVSYVGPHVGRDNRAGDQGAQGDPKLVRV
jgi:hypothetical protein